MNLDSSMMGALRCFEAAGTQQSFTRAAQVLNLTQSAISQQIRNLEERLGYPLFVRLPRGLALTPRGEVLLRSVSAALHSIQSTLEQLADGDREIQLSCLPSFALHWLMPRLAGLHRQHPQRSIRMNAAFDAISPQVLLMESIDIAIRYDNSEHAGLQPQLLMHEYLLPVASPHYLACHRGLQQGEFDDDVAFLHDSSAWSGAPPFVEWAHWLQACRPDLRQRVAGPQFNLSSLAIAAALNHQGIAMGRSALIHDELERGSLVAVGTPVLSPARYVLILNPACGPAARDVGGWLLQECAAFSAQRARLLGVPAALAAT